MMILSQNLIISKVDIFDVEDFNLNNFSYLSVLPIRL